MKNSRIGITVIVTPGGDRSEVGREEALQRRQPDRQRHALARVEHQRRPQEVVPRRDEREDRDRRQRRPDERQHDLHQIRHSPAPSTRAASSRSLGTPRNAWRSRKMLKALTRFGKISAGSVS